MKLIVATNRLCLEYRRRWEQHLKLASPEELETLKTWKAFEDWTLTLLDKTHVFDEADLMEMYTHARHNPSQDPHQFHTYLCAIEAELEKQFEPRSQKEQCLTFLVKLDPDLRCEIRQDLATGKLKLPENMSDMVRLVSDRWRARNRAMEIRHQRGYAKGSGSSRGNHRGRGLSSKSRRGRGNSNSKQQSA